jgi:hypothetical protein
MREKGIFSAESVEHHQSKHFPGTFGPWIYMGRDRWRWLVNTTARNQKGEQDAHS